MDLYYDFSALLLGLTAVSGVIWAVDAWMFKPKRVSRYQQIIDKHDLSAFNAKDLDVEAFEARLKEQQVFESVPKMTKIAEYSKSFFPVLLLVLLLRSFIVEPFRIPSGSMRPTLLEGDFILVNKFTYGLRLPLTGTHMVSLSEPKRGDIMVFRNPEDPSINFIKRVVALPGDTVSYKDKTVFINGTPAPKDYIETNYDKDSTGIERKVKHYHESLDEVEHSIYVSPISHGDYQEVTVPEGHYFVLGDNRDFSRDSRVWGFVPDKLVLGKAFYIWLSVDTQKKDMRWSRLGSISMEDKDA